MFEIFQYKKKSGTQGTRKSEKKPQSSDKTLLNFPFEASNIELIKAANNLHEASEFFVDDSRQHSNHKRLLPPRVHRSKITQKELNMLESPTAELNDALIEFWMLW